MRIEESIGNLPHEKSTPLRTLFKRLTFDVFPKTRQINSFVHSNVNVEFIKTNSKSFRDLMTYFHGTFWKHLSKGPRPENGDVLEQCVVDIRQCVRIYFQFLQ